MPSGIKDFFNGVALGITETIPGVSGGTIAIILGFYDKLIWTVNHFTRDVRKSLRFLLPLLLGVAAGIVLFSSIIYYLLTYHSMPTMVFFIGLITGIIPHIYSKIKEPGRRFKMKEIVLIVVPMMLLFVISNMKDVSASVINPAEVIQNIDAPFMWFLFFAGMIAAAALVIPGISGSFVLLLLGIYPLITYSLSLLRFLLMDITDISLMLSIGKVLVPLGIGIIIGGLSMARLIGKLLNSYYKVTYSIILGLLIGSVYALLNEPIVLQSGVSVPAILLSVVTYVVGCVTSYKLGKNRI